MTLNDAHVGFWESPITSYQLPVTSLMAVQLHGPNSRPNTYLLPQRVTTTGGVEKSRLSAAADALRAGTGRAPGLSRRLLEADAPILHLAAVTFQTDGTGGGNFHRRFQELAVAKAVRDAVFHGHFNFVPISGAVLFELLIRTGQ